MKKSERFPWYALLPMMAAFLIETLAYSGSQWINKDLEAVDLSIAGLDDQIPVVPVFVLIYIGAYLWWIIGQLMVARTNPSRFYDFIFGTIIAYAIGGLLYIAIPTTIIRPDLGSGFFERLLFFVYQNDTPERAINLMPSFHCLISWYCWIGVRNQKNIPRGYRIAALTMAILICLSTVLVKQHVLLDIPAGIVLAEASFWLSKKFHLGARFYGRINDRFHLKEKDS